MTVLTMLIKRKMISNKDACANSSNIRLASAKGNDDNIDDNDNGEDDKEQRCFCKLK